MFRLTNYPLLTFAVTFTLMWLGTWAGMYLRRHWRGDSSRFTMILESSWEPPSPCWD